MEILDKFSYGFSIAVIIIIIFVGVYPTPLIDMINNSVALILGMSYDN